MVLVSEEAFSYEVLQLCDGSPALEAVSQREQ